MSRTQIRTIIVLLIAVHVAAGLFLTPFGLAAGTNPLVQHVTLAGIGALIAQPALLALWAALGPQSNTLDNPFQPAYRRARFAALATPLVLLLMAQAAVIPGRLELWREMAEKRRWSEVGLRAMVVNGEITSIASDYASSLLTDPLVVDRIATCRQLQQLDLTGSNVDDTTLERFTGLPRLWRLTLDGTRVSDDGLHHLARFHGLRQLDLAMTDITDDGLIVLAGLKTLSSVNLTHTRVTPEGVRWLKQTRPGMQVNAVTRDRSLQAVASRFRPRSRGDLQARAAVPLRLNAIGPKVTDLGVAYLRGMTSIEKLDLTDTQVSDAALNDLITLTGLKQLVLSGTQVTDSGIGRLRQALPECEIVR